MFLEWLKLVSEIWYTNLRRIISRPSATAEILVHKSSRFHIARL